MSGLVAARLNDQYKKKTIAARRARSLATARQANDRFAEDMRSVRDSATHSVRCEAVSPTAGGVRVKFGHALLQAPDIEERGFRATR